MPNYQENLLIIGAGPSGLTAGIYAARANLSPVILGGLQPGGQMTLTSEVENYPGFADVVQGTWLMETMQKQAMNVGAKIVYDIVNAVDFSQYPFRCVTDQDVVYSAKSIIIATGARARWLGLPSEEHFKGCGVSACAICDGSFYRDKNVVVVGGGNTAVEEALYLVNICRSVTLVHRRDSLRAEKILQHRLLNNDKITVIWNSVVEEVLGSAHSSKGVEAIRINNLNSGESIILPAEGLFVAIGHDPATKLFIGELSLDHDGYLIVEPGSTRTSVSGIFAAGDCADKIYRQAITAAGMGCMAALEAEKYLAKCANKDVHETYSK
ncbi:thioredoxin-disulfide reductase [Candidatus Endolissoclinum faulkneri L2]|uniref:Thioredoxin reductase n=1 Tax=Candidatus Endolissoclinum faulkneri L2 TaxID=1193729 RepID=K7YST0_9PROT|nr:thioredoxin-disulfide reductase [Candidatus Endolissoclinum faulkneri]AFX99624.1 thioredoxin-disulfide reductase [Candidatus Endolissoclinum faulkneri L2]